MVRKSLKNQMDILSYSLCDVLGLRDFILQRLQLRRDSLVPHFHLLVVLL